MDKEDIESKESSFLVGTVEKKENNKIPIYQTKCPILFIKSQEWELDCLCFHPKPEGMTAYSYKRN